VFSYLPVGGIFDLAISSPTFRMQAPSDFPFELSLEDFQRREYRSLCPEKALGSQSQGFSTTCTIQAKLPCVGYKNAMPQPRDEFSLAERTTPF